MLSMAWKGLQTFIRRFGSDPRLQYFTQNLSLAQVLSYDAQPEVIFPAARRLSSTGESNLRRGFTTPQGYE